MNAPEPSSGRRMQDILAQAFKRKSPSEQAAFLKSACAGDPALRAELEALLDREAQQQGTDELSTEPVGILLQEGITELAPTLLDEIPASEGPGATVGRYKLLEQIGAGGFGVVYVAEQREPVRRQVALKIIKLGMDTRQVVARFEAERQALALMDHPNIAKVFDAGATETGRPFFVMELVKGVPITSYCDQEKLSTKQRLDLFIHVCQAIQHAHQKGIIHRDIKPSNILVALQEGKPVPKVIDFGIAKATQQKLTEKTLHTQLQQFIGTPAYMSPEQAEMSGLDIDTRSDIYSLGVLLYELLVGKTPFDSKELLAAGFDEIRRTIREKEPTRPSTRLTQELVAAAVTRWIAGDAEQSASSRRRLQDLVRQLKGDLDWIVMKCLEKDRTRRYETANGLAADLKRYLENEPVVARPPSTAYRFQKALRRNKLVFTSAAVVAMVLVIGVFVSTRQALRAMRAEREQARLRAAADAKSLEAAQAQAREAELRRNAEAQEHLTRLRAYLADINLADQALAETNLGVARELLERYRPAEGIHFSGQVDDLRGWEWRYLWQRARGSQRVILNAFAPVARVVISPNLDFVAALGSDGVLRVWNYSSRRLEKELRGFPSLKIYSGLALSKDGGVLAAGNSDRLAVLETRGWKTIREMNGARPPYLLVPGRPWLIYGTNGGLNISDMNTRTQRFIATPGYENAICSPDGARCVIAAQDWFQILDLDSGTVLRSLTNALGRVDSLAYSPDGSLLVAGGMNGKVEVRNAADLSLIKAWQAHANFTGALGFSPDGRLLVTAAASDQSLHLWGVPGWRDLGEMRGHGNGIWALATAPHDPVVVSGDRDGTIRIWDLESPRPDELERSYGVPLGFLPDGSRLVTLSTNGVVSFWDPVARHEIDSWQVTSTGAVTAGALTTDGTLLALGYDDGRLDLWELPARRQRRSFATGTTAVGLIQFTPTGQLVAAKGAFSKREPTMQGFLRAWNTATGNEEILPIGKNVPVTRMAYSSHGTLIAVALPGGMVEVWDYQSRNKRASLAGHTWEVADIAFSPDDKHIATAGWDTTARLWDATSGLQLAKFVGQQLATSGVGFAPDGSTLAITDGLGVTRFHKMKTFQKTVSLLASSSLTGGSVLFSPDGSCVTSAGNLIFGASPLYLGRAPGWSEIETEQDSEERRGR